MVPARAAGTADREPQGAVCAASGRLSGCAQKIRAGCESDASRRRLFHLHYVAGRRSDHGRAHGRCEAKFEPGRRSGVFPERWGRTFPAAAVLRSDNRGNRRGYPSARGYDQGTVGAYSKTDTGFETLRSARYFQKAGNTGMHSSTATRHTKPPLTTEMLLEEIVATHPARAFPNNGPLR